MAALARLAGNLEDPETLQASCATGSLRRAGDLPRLQHNNVVRPFEQIGQPLGVDLTEPAELLRAELAFTA